MNVLLCATCGTRLTEPVRRLDAMPEYPGWDGLPDPDGRRYGPASVRRGTYLPLVSAGPHSRYVLDPLDTLGLVPHADDCCSRHETRLLAGAVRVEGVA